MIVFNKEFEVESEAGKVTYIDITQEVRKAITESGVQTGTVSVISPHTTCAVFYEEYTHDLNEQGDELLQEDLNRVLEKIIPPHDSAETYLYPGEEHYQAVESWPNALDYLPGGDRSALWNGDAHLKATILGSSEVFAVEEGALGVGKTGYIYFADFDRARARTRKCKVVVMGK